MIHIGISAGYHDSAITVIDNAGTIRFAGHSERYSKKKHDSNLNTEIVSEALSYVDDIFTLSYYENPLTKLTRQIYSGEPLKLSNLSFDKIIGIESVQLLEDHYFKYCTSFLDWNQLIFHGLKPSFRNHHKSHASAGFQTSKFERATVVVIDAIGEWDTVSIWGAEYDKNNRARYTKLWSLKYPHSIGLFYSAMTKRLGLKPLDEEYITMGMAGWGKDNISSKMENMFVKDYEKVQFKQNFHRGIDSNLFEEYSDFTIAASTQSIAEKFIRSVMERARKFNWSNNLVYGGGVALNCLANRFLGDYFDRIWILPNPGDAGSSLGACALSYGNRVDWNNAYLGHNISGDYPICDIMAELLSNRIVGVASGRAEFGPRALGNRSLLADPRGADIKDRVNEIKQRQKFRPFAPVILEEFASDYFEMPIGWNSSPYMQVVSVCKYPEKYPAIVHIDGTSRVQTVGKDGSGIRKLLESWYKETGCPLLLNTSLNIRGEPMVNDVSDAKRFEQMYGVKVCT